MQFGMFADSGGLEHDKQKRDTEAFGAPSYATPLSEGSDGDFRLGIKQKAYSVQELGGLVFAYMGDNPAPPLPNLDFLAVEDERHVKITGVANCNWLQCAENGIDPLHVSFLHADV
jgi:phenylpropionate dioxygenase-like ring-hydroxylating dioxygenase large terminal subunit